MPRRPRFDQPGHPQHVVVQAIDRRPLFRSRRDKALFLRRTRLVIDDTDARVLAWALMTTHVHFCVTPESVPLGKVVQRIVGPFARSFNARHRRAGPLVSGRYWSRPVGDEDDLLTVIGYVCLNPLRGGLVRRVADLASYPWTSAREILGSTRPRRICDVDSVLRLMTPTPRGAKDEFVKMLRTHAAADGVPEPSPLTIRDAADLTERWTVALPNDAPGIDEELADREIQTSRRLLLERRGWDLERVVRRAADLSHTKPVRVRCGGRRPREVAARQLVALFAHDILGISDCDIGRALGVSRQAICRARLRLLDRDDRQLARWREFFESEG